jgi:hypothetical protein
MRRVSWLKNKGKKPSPKSLRNETFSLLKTNLALLEYAFVDELATMRRVVA